MALLPCEGCYDGYPADDWKDNYEEDPQDKIDALAERIHDEISCGDITEFQGRAKFMRLTRSW